MIVSLGVRLLAPLLKGPYQPIYFSGPDGWAVVGVGVGWWEGIDSLRKKQHKLIFSSLFFCAESRVKFHTNSSKECQAKFWEKLEICSNFICCYLIPAD